MTTKFGIVFYILSFNFVDGNVPKVNKCCQETEVRCQIKVNYSSKHSIAPPLSVNPFRSQTTK